MTDDEKDDAIQIGRILEKADALSMLGGSMALRGALGEEIRERDARVRADVEREFATRLFDARAEATEHFGDWQGWPLVEKRLAEPVRGATERACDTCGSTVFGPSDLVGWMICSKCGADVEAATCATCHGTPESYAQFHDIPACPECGGSGKAAT